jgi:hypothetical protein
MKPCHVCTTAILAVTLAFSTTAFAQAPVSDDFNSYNLNRSVWMFVNPKGDAMLRMIETSTENASVAITVPGGTDHQPFPPANTSPRIMQSVADSNFEIQVKFISPMNEPYQMLGVLVEGEESKAIRFDLSCQGDSIWLYGYTTSDDFASGTPQLNIWRSLFPSGTTPLYLRITRVGNSYFVMDSTDGLWGTRVGGFTFEMKALRVGVYVGNFGFPAPAFTGVIDYFFDMNSPLPDDDISRSVIDTTGPYIYDVASIAGQQSITASWKTDEPSTGTVEYGLTTLYGSSVEDTALKTLHTVTLDGLSL